MDNFPFRYHKKFKSCALDSESFENLKNSNTVVFNITTKAHDLENWFLLNFEKRADSSNRGGLWKSCQISRAIYFKTKGVLTCPVAESSIVILGTEDKTTFINDLDELLNKDFIYTIEKTQGTDEVLCKCIIFTMLCKMLKSGKWIQIGESMDYMVSSEFKNPSTDKQVVLFTCDLVSYKRRDDPEESIINMTIRMVVLVVNVNSFKSISKEMVGEKVLCLPMCTGYGKIREVRKSNEEVRNSLKSYWERCNGYFLEEKDLETIISVTFGNGGYDYPSVLLLRSPIVALPSKSRELKRNAVNLVLKEIDQLGGFTLTPLNHFHQKCAPPSLMKSSQIDKESDKSETFKVEESEIFKCNVISKSTKKVELPPRTLLRKTLDTKTKRPKLIPPPLWDFTINKTTTNDSQTLEISEFSVLTKDFWEKLENEINK